MCTVVILLRPDHEWPVLLAANRDEMADRPWQGPARHWPELPSVTAGKDQTGGGTWLGMNDAGVVCGVLNRVNTLGPAPGLESRGRLPLLVLAEPTAESGVEHLSRLDARRYRPFNAFVIDAKRGFWVRAAGEEETSLAASRLDIAPLPSGLSMLTAYDLNDERSARIRLYRPLFAEAGIPEPLQGDWYSWQALLASRAAAPGAGARGGMTIETETGFGTVCSSLIALPAPGQRAPQPVWLFAAGPPDKAQFCSVP